MAVIAEELSFIYNRKSPFEKKAIDNLSFNIKKGEFFGIIGHTGSGKSTLIQHFNALIRPQTGKLVVAGHDLQSRSTNLKQLRGDVGMVFQYPEYQLFAENVYKDVMFGLANFNEKLKTKKGQPEDNRELLSQEQMHEMVVNAINLVGLDFETVKDKSPFDLSGGEKRRVAIAGVIVTKPKILILDEPSSGLDPRGKQEIMELIHHLKNTTTPTIIMISHDMDEVAENCDRIAVLNKGKMEFILEPNELYKHEDRLVELGLDVPLSVKIANQLRGMGLGIDCGVKNLNELASAIAGGDENA